MPRRVRRSSASSRFANHKFGIEQPLRTYLPGRHNLAVIDLQADSPEAHEIQVLAAPTLVRNRPLPVRTFVGDLSHTDLVLAKLG